MICDFCKYYGDLVKYSRTRVDDPMFHIDYHDLILERAWNDYTGTAHAGFMTHRPKAVGFDLKYPECGKKLEEVDA